MSVKISDDASVEATTVAKWFVYGVVISSVVFNVREIAAVVYSVV